jgi:hypothetical protein
MPIEHADTCHNKYISNASYLPSAIEFEMKPPGNEIRPLSDYNIEQGLQSLYKYYTGLIQRSCKADAALRQGLYRA